MIAWILAVLIYGPGPGSEVDPNQDAPVPFAVGEGRPRAIEHFDDGPVGMRRHGQDEDVPGAHCRQRALHGQWLDGGEEGEPEPQIYGHRYTQIYTDLCSSVSICGCFDLCSSVSICGCFDLC